MTHSTRAATLFSVAIFAFMATYHWAAWPLMGASLWMTTGRDPLWLVEHGAAWLRAALIRWACLLSWKVLQQFAGAKELVVEE